MNMAFIKAWCRIDGDQFDDTLPMLVDSALALANHETGRSYPEEDIPSAVRAWVAAQVSYWINNPAAATAGAMMPSPFHRALIDRYRVFA